MMSLRIKVRFGTIIKPPRLSSQLIPFLGTAAPQQICMLSVIGLRQHEPVPLTIVSLSSNRHLTQTGTIRYLSQEFGFGTRTPDLAWLVSQDAHSIALSGYVFHSQTGESEEVMLLIDLIYNCGDISMSWVMVLKKCLYCIFYMFKKYLKATIFTMFFLWPCIIECLLQF